MKNDALPAPLVSKRQGCVARVARAGFSAVAFRDFSHNMRLFNQSRGAASEVPTPPMEPFAALSKPPQSNGQVSVGVDKHERVKS